MLGIYLVTGDVGKVMGIVSPGAVQHGPDYALTTIPMFILMAFFSASRRLARDLYTAAANCARTSGAASPSPPYSPAGFSVHVAASTAAASVMSKIGHAGDAPPRYSDELAAVGMP